VPLYRDRMAMPGRHPFETIDAVPFGEHRHLRPPDSLSAAARRHFVDLISTSHSRQFQAADLPLLCRWAELCAICERAEREFAVTGPVLSNGEQSAWWDVYVSSVKSLTILAIRLRLGPQSRAFKQPKPKVLPTSVYSRMELEHDG